MRNIFDQYKHPENRLTHSLVACLDQDKALLKDFLATFGPSKIPPLKTLQLVGQGLPGSMVTLDEDEAERRGLPDAIIFNDDGWGLVIESKINSSLTKDQLYRHTRTIKRCGISELSGLAITVSQSAFSFTGWRMATWKDIYAWANGHQSPWAKHMVNYFNVAENRMTQGGYLKEGTITEFAGINLDPYSYPEGKRILRLLTEKIRRNAGFMREMGLDPASRRPAITDDMGRVWDLISFESNNKREKSFTSFPHCTFNISGRYHVVEAMITFPNAMDRALYKRLRNSSYENFAQQMKLVLKAVEKNLRGTRGYKPVARIVHRHYKTQKSRAVIDGEMNVDLRGCFGGKDHDMGRAIVGQEQWMQAIHALLNNKRANLQFQIGIQFSYESCATLKTRDADKLLMKGLRSFIPFMKYIIGTAPNKSAPLPREKHAT